MLLHLTSGFQVRGPRARGPGLETGFGGVVFRGSKHRGLGFKAGVPMQRLRQDTVEIFAVKLPKYTLEHTGLENTEA